ncbi:hypothetical protein DFH06DRAFT_373357 [Mycena polygramma]|nr:hypothetical protein DFH06DRAFT_373357 [Mycena polygramma]
MASTCWNGGVPDELTGGLTRLRMGNDAPFDSEIPLIRWIISDAEERLVTLESQIRSSETEVALPTLVQRRDEAAEHLREHRAILHPLRRVPPELICEIFAFALDDSANDNELGYAPPWYLGQICRSWRLCALAYPRLWSNITIPSSPATSRDRATLEALVARSSNVPLNVLWTAQEDKRVVDAKSADLALAHCRRWATLRLDLTGLSIDAAAGTLDWLQPVKGYLPSLSRLEVLCDVDDETSLRIPDVFLVVTTLRQVFLTDWQFVYYSPDLHLPWDQITHYRGAYDETIQLNTLRTAPNLVQCALSFETPGIDSTTPVDLHSILLSHLRQLCIRKPRYLYHLTAPSLKELYCSHVLHDDIFALHSFVRHSNCVLQKLVITACYTLSELISVLRGLPSLSYLLIQPHASVAEQTDLFHKLEITGTSHVICPNLSSLVYGYSINNPLLREPFFAMIQSRIRSSPLHSRLTYLRIADPIPRTEILSATRELSEEGIDADVLSDTELANLTGRNFFL